MTIQTPDDLYFQDLKERYKSCGLSQLDDREILELLLLRAMPKSKVRTAADNLIKRFGTLCCILERSPEVLLGTEGITQQAAVFLNLQSSLHRRCSFEKSYTKHFDKTKSKKLLQALFIGRTTEHFYIIMLNSKNKILAIKCIAKGTLRRVNIYLRHILELALIHKADKIVLVHNHPNGNRLPSPEDIKLTYNVNDALEVINVEMVDHFIVTDECVTSLNDDIEIFKNRPKQSRTYINYDMV